MRKLKDIKKDIVSCLNIYNKSHGTALTAKIQKNEELFLISIYEHPPRHHFFQSPPIGRQSFSSNAFLKLNKSALNKVIIDLATESIEAPRDDYEEPIGPGAELHK